MADSQLQRFVVLAVHPTSGAAYDVSLIASSERAAISRTRGTLFHRDRDVAWLDGEYLISSVEPL